MQEIIDHPFPSLPQDMLENLVPLEVHNAMVDYESKKGSLVQAEVGRMREATQLMNG